MGSTTPTPDPTAEIADLVPLMEKAGIVRRYTGRPHKMFRSGSLVSIRYNSKSDLRYILRGTAEDWLRGRGWKPSKYWNRYNHPKIEGITDFILPAALAAEIEKGVG